MLTKDEFIRHILGEAPRTKSRAAKKDTGHIEGFDFADDAPDSEATEDTRFVTPLLQAGFGDGQGIPRATVIRSTDAVAKYIPDEVRYWPKTPTRPHHTLLIEANLTHRELLAIPAFKSRQLAHLDIAEDAIARLVAEALVGFQRGAEGLDASALKGQKHETLCVVSIIDEREGNAGRLACFGTFNAKTAGLETFFLTEHSRTWDRADARERLGLTYERQFKKLGEASWQEAFTTTDERYQAEKLLEVCTKKNVTEKDVQESILDLLDTIARGFGLRKKADAERRLRAFPLPGQHDIGIDSEEREQEYGGTNPFSGVTLRDDQSRLLGYIVYPLKTKSQAEKLRQHLEKHNRFHNVLVVYPDANQASIELWQGREQLTGKLRKGQSGEDAADVVNLLSRFFVVSKAKVRNPAELAQELAYRARYLRRLALRQLEDEPEKGPLRNLYNAFKAALVHDQKEDEFADAFAQTITYGLLTARWLGNDQLAATGDRFTRQSALKYLPAASPFLNDLFKAVLSLKLDEQRGRLLWLVDDVADLLDRIDVTYVFGAGDKGSDTATDPVIHFYEPFLAAYDKDLKNKRGVFFTPRAVVSFIVRSVHEQLKTVFGLQDGLGSTDTWGDLASRNSAVAIPESVKKTDTFVQILDPATGTGTFLFECIGVIEQTVKERWRQELNATSWDHPGVKERWNEYVPSQLLPRLSGYELMMAPYSVAHLKIAFKLSETGYQPKASDRIHVYLTNALEPPTDVQASLKGLAPALAEEAIAVNARKRADRSTVVLGNPPYSNFGQLNRNGSILGLLEDYKRNLAERKINLDDDFIKFFRFGHELIRRVGAGVLGLITNHAYLDGVTHRRMREMLISDFSQIQVVDLHGNARKAEVTNDGANDENVFDIMQGVAIGVFCTHRSTESPILIAHLRGTRQDKYVTLAGKIPGQPAFEAISPSAPYFLISSMNREDSGEYERGIPLSEVFRTYQSPIQTKRDALTIHFTEEELNAVLSDLRRLPQAELRSKYKLAPDGRDWTLAAATADVKNGKGVTVRIGYKPFDIRYTYFSGKTKGFLAYPRTSVMRHMLGAGSRAFVFKRQGREDACGYTYFFVVNCPFSEGLFAIDPRGREFIAPLALVPGDDENGQQELGTRRSDREHNFSLTFLKKLALALGVPQDPSGLPKNISADDVFNYAYAVVSSLIFRKRFEASLRVDFPRLPITSNKTLFTALSTLGKHLADLHVLSERNLTSGACSWVGGGPFLIEKVVYSDEVVWIDKKRTIGCKGVPQVAWDYWIGGYQVCNKWLERRKGRVLSDAEREHFKHVVFALIESARVTANIDKTIESHGGWSAAFSQPDPLATKMSGQHQTPAHKCTHCGSETTPGEMSCKACGAELPPPAGGGALQPRRRTER